MSCLFGKTLLNLAWIELQKSSIQRIKIALACRHRGQSIFSNDNATVKFFLQTDNPTHVSASSFTNEDIIRSISTSVNKNN